MKVKVYFNLHRKLFSVVALEGPLKGRVIDYQRDVMLRNVTFKVSEAGRQRVLREKKKNVHAFAVGDWHAWIEPVAFDWPIYVVTYNPYKYCTFVEKETEKPVRSASRAWLHGKSIWAVDIA